MGMEADIARIATDITWIRQNAEKAEAREAARDARIDRLEERQDKAEADARATRAWAAGAAAATAFLATTLKDWVVPVLKGLLATIAIVYLLTGTAGCAETPTSNARWYGPVEYVIDADMLDDCVVTAHEAVLFWEGQGVDYLYVKAASGDWKGFTSRCPDGSICITARPQEGTAGLTYRRTWEAAPTWMAAAEIELNPEDCRGSKGVMVAAHELGHGLGLNDLGAGYRGNLMCESTLCFGAVLEKWQLDHVRQ